jgi:hypothetical protein
MTYDKKAGAHRLRLFFWGNSKGNNRRLSPTQYFFACKAGCRRNAEFRARRRQRRRFAPDFCTGETTGQAMLGYRGQNSSETTVIELSPMPNALVDEDTQHKFAGSLYLGVRRNLEDCGTFDGSGCRA